MLCAKRKCYFATENPRSRTSHTLTPSECESGERERENRIEKKRQSEKDTYSTHCTHWHRHQAHALSNVYNYDLCLARSCCYYMPLCFHFLQCYCCYLRCIFSFVRLAFYIRSFFSDFGIVGERQISNLLRVIKRCKMRK